MGVVILLKAKKLRNSLKQRAGVSSWSSGESESVFAACIKLMIFCGLGRSSPSSWRICADSCASMVEDSSRSKLWLMTMMAGSVVSRSVMASRGGGMADECAELGRLWRVGKRKMKKGK